MTCNCDEEQEQVGKHQQRTYSGCLVVPLQPAHQKPAQPSMDNLAAIPCTTWFSSQPLNCDSSGNTPVKWRMWSTSILISLVVSSVCSFQRLSGWSAVLAVSSFVVYLLLSDVACCS